MDNLIQFFFSLLVAAAASWITVQLSLRRFYAEKWWERKADAYTAIIESFYHMLQFYNDEILNYYSEKDLPAERVAAHRAKYQQAKDEIDKALDIGSFVMSDVAVAKLTDFTKESKKVDEQINFTIHTAEAYASTQRSLVHEYLESIRETAQRDLGVYHTPANRVKGIRGFLKK